MTTKLTIGEWLNSTPEELNRFVDKFWNRTEEFQSVMRYIEKGKFLKKYKGYSQCLLCNARLGVRGIVSPDSKWVFPEGFSHYILKHSIKPNKLKFIKGAVLWVKSKELNLSKLEQLKDTNNLLLYCKRLQKF